MLFRRSSAIMMLLLLAGLLLTGCTRVEDHLTINADGSGTIVIKTIQSEHMPPQLFMQRGMMANQAPIRIYPPMNSEEAEVLFPGDDFTIEESADEDGPVQTISISFKNVNDLLASPYADIRALSISADAESGKLVVQSRGGLHAIGSIVSALTEEYADQAMSSMELGKEKIDEIESEFSASFTITLPNDVTAEDGEADGNTVVWTVARADYESRDAFSKDLQRVMVASCSLNNITFKPDSPMRMNLHNFDSLKEGGVGEGDKVSIDTEKVLSQAEVKPLVVMHSRTSNYTGESWGNENAGWVVAYVTLPKEFKPLRWSEFQVDKIVDDQGNDLMQQIDEDRMGYGVYGIGYDLNQEQGMFGPSTPKDTTQAVRYFYIPFNTPEPTAKNLTTIEGSIKAMYGGQPMLIKLPGVIESIGDSNDFNMIDDEAGIDNPSLKQANLNLQVRYISNDGPMVSIMLTAESDETLIKNVQVFDSKGQPFPTYNASGYGMGDDDDLHLMVVGQPEPPLSLALLVDAASMSVQVPVRFTDLPLHQTKEGGGE